MIEMTPVLIPGLVGLKRMTTPIESPGATASGYELTPGGRNSGVLTVISAINNSLKAIL